MVLCHQGRTPAIEQHDVSLTQLTGLEAREQSLESVIVFELPEQRSCRRSFNDFLSLSLELFVLVVSPWM